VEVQLKPLSARVANSQTTFGNAAQWLAITSIQITRHFMNVMIWWRIVDQHDIKPHVMLLGSAAVIFRFG
jgi:hypothetical protein